MDILACCADVTDALESLNSVENVNVFSCPHYYSGGRCDREGHPEFGTLIDALTASCEVSWPVILADVVLEDYGT